MQVRNKLTIAVLTALVIYQSGCAISKCDKKLFDELKNASSHLEEREIAIKINKNCPPDRFQYLDESGKVISPANAQTFKEAYSLVLYWDSGVKIKHKIINPANVGVFIGE